MSSIQPRLKSAELIQSGVTSPTQTLTGSDLLVGHVGIPLFYVYPQGLDIDRMRRAMKELLVHHPLCTGRMQRDAKGVDILVGNDAGVSLRVWDCDTPMPDYGPRHLIHKDVRTYAKSILPWHVLRGQCPLVQIEVYRFHGGKTLLVVHGVHSAFDGSSMWNFLVDWQRVANGQNVVGPVHERQELLTLMQSCLDYPDTREIMCRPSFWEKARVFPQLGLQALRNKPGFVRIPISAIQALRNELPANTPGLDRISTADIVTTHALQLMSQTQGHERTRTVGLVSDLRYRKGLGLPQRLFGNALVQESMDFSWQELQTSSAAELALKFKRPGATHSMDELKGYLGMIERHRRARTLRQLLPRYIMNPNTGGFLQNNYHQLPIYQLDLGTGQPTWFNPFAVPFRMLKIAPTPSGDGGVDLHITATPEELQPLVQRYGTPDPN